MSNSNLKVCRSCNIEKLISDFYKNQASKDGLQPNCKECCKKLRQEYYYRNWEKLKAKREAVKKLKPSLTCSITQTKVCCICKERQSWSGFHKNKANKDGMERKCRACSSQLARARRQRKLEEYRAKESKRRENKRESLNNYARKYYRTNLEKRRAAAKEVYKRGKKRKFERVRERYHTEPMFKLNQCTRRAIGHCLKGKKNRKRWSRLVGYSATELQNHIESLFTEGMSWEQYLNGQISIDHKVPLSLFTFKGPEDPQFRACWSLDNLQPMWKQKNLEKNDLLPDGRKASRLTEQEKAEYLTKLGLISTIQ